MTERTFEENLPCQTLNYLHAEKKGQRVRDGQLADKASESDTGEAMVRKERLPKLDHNHSRKKRGPRKRLDVKGAGLLKM
jgi:hypothetical protein